MNFATAINISIDCFFVRINKSYKDRLKLVDHTWGAKIEKPPRVPVDPGRWRTTSHSL